MLGGIGHQVLSFFFFLSIPGDSDVQPRQRTTGSDHPNSPVQLCDSMSCTEFNAIPSEVTAERESGLKLLRTHSGERPPVGSRLVITYSHVRSSSGAVLR